MAITLNHAPDVEHIPPAPTAASAAGQVPAAREPFPDPRPSPGRQTPPPVEPAFLRLRGTSAHLLSRHVKRDKICGGCGRLWPCPVATLAENNLALLRYTTPGRRPSDRTSRTAGSPPAADRRIAPHQPALPRHGDEATPDPRSRANPRTAHGTATLAAVPEPAVHLRPHRVWSYPAGTQSAHAARRDVAAQLHRWKLDHLIEPASRTTIEMITNAVAASQPADDNPTSKIAMRVTYSASHVLLEVWDGGPADPPRRTTEPTAEHGRDLQLVTGYYPARVRTADGTYRKQGKVVWTALSHDTPPPRRIATAPGDVPSRRERFAAHAESSETPYVFDLALLQRVLDGLHNLDSRTAPSHPRSPTLALLAPG